MEWSNILTEVKDLVEGNYKNLPLDADQIRMLSDEGFAVMPLPQHINPRGLTLCRVEKCPNASLKRRVDNLLSNRPCPLIYLRESELPLLTKMGIKAVRTAYSNASKELFIYQISRMQ